MIRGVRLKARTIVSAESDNRWHGVGRGEHVAHKETGLKLEIIPGGREMEMSCFEVRRRPESVFTA